MMSSQNVVYLMKFHRNKINVGFLLKKNLKLYFPFPYILCVSVTTKSATE